MSTFTDADLAELVERLQSGEVSAIKDAVKAVKPARQPKIRSPRSKPTALDQLKANVDSAIKAADHLLALRNELIQLQANRPAFGDSNFQRPIMIQTEIMYAYSKLNDSVVYLLPRMRRLLDTYETLPETLK